MLHGVPDEEGICIWQLVLDEVEVDEAHVIVVAILASICKHQRTDDVGTRVLQIRKGFEMRLPIAITGRAIKERLDAK